MKGAQNLGNIVIGYRLERLQSRSYRINCNSMSLAYLDHKTLLIKFSLEIYRYIAIYKYMFINMNIRGIINGDKGGDLGHF